MSTTSTKQHEVVDASGHTYVLTEKLGKGGQGVVWKTDNPKVLVKGFTAKDQAQKERWLEQITWLMRQDLVNLNIARPLALLRAPRAGYVLELMDGLIPLTQLLQSFADDGIEGYLRRGGVKRRVQLLMKLASTLSLLHSRGMAFGDLSPDNIYVSAETEHAELWLIDCDNISFESQPCRALYTPDYGAPELVRGEADFSTLTDIWSFAVIAYQLLTGNHPFKGGMVINGEFALEEQALRGDLPWICHAEDRSNATECGIALGSVATGKLTQLFALCFEQGLTEPTERPSMAHWLEALHQVNERIVRCQSCTSSYLFNRECSCPFCETALADDYVLLTEYHFIPPEQLPELDGNDSRSKGSLDKTGRFAVLQPGCKLMLRTNIPSQWYSESLPPLLQLELLDDGLWIEPLQSKVAIQRESKINQVPRRMKLNAELRGASDAEFLLHVGDLAEPHLLWRFKW